MRLNRNFAPAYDSLAMLYARQNRHLAEAQTLSERAVELEPESLNFRLNGAEVLAQERKFDDALEELKAAGRLAKTPVEAAAVERRMKRIEQYQAR